MSGRHSLTDAVPHTCHRKQAHIMDQVRLPLDHLAEEPRSKEVETKSRIEVQGDPLRPQDFVTCGGGGRLEVSRWRNMRVKSTTLTFVVSPAP